MILYDCATAPSPRRARIFLHEKNAPHEVVQIDLMQAEQLGDKFKAINPNCTVPVLELDDGTRLTENAGIAAYLESAFPAPDLLGKSALEKGVIATWNAKIEFAGLSAIAEALRNASPMMQGRALPGTANFEQIPALVERGMVRLNNFMSMLNERLEGREFIARDDFSYADITAAVTVDFARVVKVKPTAEEHPNIVRWRSALATRPSLQV